MAPASESYESGVDPWRMHTCGEKIRDLGQSVDLVKGLSRGIQVMEE